HAAQPHPFPTRRSSDLEVSQHLIAEDERKRNRDQRLAKLLALVPAQEELVHDETDETDPDRRDGDRPGPANHLMLLELECDVRRSEEHTSELQSLAYLV